MIEVILIDRSGHETEIIKFNKTNEREHIYQVFPEDTIFDIRHKIALATGIPIYAQFLYIKPDGPFYTIFTENFQKVSIDLRELYSPAADVEGFGFDVPIDRYLYENRIFLRIQSTEHYSTAEGLQKIYVTDINIFLDEIKKIFSRIGQNETMLNTIYYGFVIKYWPIISREVFTDLIYSYTKGDREIFLKYPQLATIENQIALQTKLISQLYACKKLIDLNITINNAILSSYPFSATINVYNLFDYFELDDSHIPISLYIPADSKNIQPNVDEERMREVIQKEVYRKTFDMYIEFPSQFKISNSATFCILTDEGDQIFVCFEEDRFQIKMIMSKVKITSFKVQLEIAKKYVNPLLERVNALKKYITPAEIYPISDRSVFYGTISLTLYWPQHITNTAFDKFNKSIIEQYVRGGIFQIIEQSFQGAKNLYFIKGPVGNVKSIDAKTSYFFNYYSFLTNSDTATLWKSVYHGSYVKITHTQGDVRFEINNIKQHLIPLIRRYISQIIGVHANDLISTKAEKEIKIKKLRRLHEYDPVLYSLRDNKIENADKLYSVICQEPNQPIIYSDRDLDTLSAKRRKNLTEYWNFTTKEPAYYECPHPDYPHLMFIVGKHPDGFCLPCCKKRALDQIRKNSDLFESCLSKHIYKEGAETEEEIARSKTYIFEFSRNALEAGRFGNVPNFIEFIKAFGKKGDDDLDSRIVSIGVEQVNISSKEYGFIESIMYLFGIKKLSVLIDILTKNISENLRNQIIKTWITPDAGEIYDLDWKNIFIKLCCTELKVQPYIVTISESNIILESIAGIELDQSCFILRKQSDIITSYEPIVEVTMGKNEKEDSLIVTQTIWKIYNISYRAGEENIHRKVIVDKYITFMNNMIGGLKDTRFYPAEEIIIPPTSSAELLENINFFDSKLVNNASSNSSKIIAQLDSNKKIWSLYSEEDNHLYLGRVEKKEKEAEQTGKIWPYNLKNTLKILNDQKAPEVDERAKNINRSYYKLLFYEMVLSEFSKQLRMNKNEKIRARAVEYIRDKKMPELRKLLINEKDFKTILYQMNEYKNIDKLTEIIDETSYQFDQFVEIFTMEPHHQRIQIEQIIKRFLKVREEEPSESDIQIENNYLIYEPRHINMWTRIVGPYEKLIEMLIADINNPLKRYIFTAGVEIKNLHPFVFKSRVGEVVKTITI